MADYGNQTSAQQALYDMTTNDDDGNGNDSSTFWNVQIASDLYIVHYSNRVKPWELVALEAASANNNNKKNATTTKHNSLQVLWKTWYQKSKNYLLRLEKEREKEERQRQQARARQPPPRSPPPQQQQQQQSHPQQIHKAINKRYKALRAQGMSTQEAMQQARVELDPNHGQETDVRSQVASMFGMM